MSNRPDSPSNGLKPCVFIDRDGVITVDVGYCNHPDRLELLPGAAEAIRRINQAGMLAIVMTNQSGVARGIFTEDVLALIHQRMHELLAEGGARVDALYYAPFHKTAADPRYRDDPDQMRKPGIGMIRKACSDFPIDMARAWMIGDKPGDIEFARNAGIPGVMVKTGYGLGEIQFKRDEWKVQPTVIVENIGEAVDWILKQ
ncbi:MAG: HAD family hydrolase [Candidatus Sumerlaeia bacterium]